MASPRLCRSAALTGFADLARALGLDPLRLAKRAGVPAAALGSPDLRIATDGVGRLLESAARRAGAEDFGLRLAETRRLSNMGAVALIAREQPTLRRALQVMAQYQRLQNEAMSLAVEEAGDIVVLRLRAAGAGPRPLRQAMELSVGVLCRNIRALVGERWRPEFVYFRHATPASLVTHWRLFGVKPLFDQPFDGLVFARAVLNAPVGEVDPEMARQVARYVDQLAAVQRAVIPRERVEELIGLLLPTGTCAINKVAQHLGVDRRTVHRWLSAEGTTFSALVDQARRTLAEAALRDGRRIGDVSLALGYASTSAFSRWYRDTYGCSARSMGARLKRKHRLT